MIILYNFYCEKLLFLFSIATIP